MDHSQNFGYITKNWPPKKKTLLYKSQEKPLKKGRGWERMNVGEMTVWAKWMNVDEKQGARRKMWRRASTRERERERERERASPRQNSDSRRRTNPSAWLRRRARRVAEGGDAATAAIFVPLSTGVKEATNVEGEDDDDDEEGRQTRPVTTTIAGLVKEAAQLFHPRSYQVCLLILNQLLVQNETDPKITSSKILPAL